MRSCTDTLLFFLELRILTEGRVQKRVWSVAGFPVILPRGIPAGFGRGITPIVRLHPCRGLLAVDRELIAQAPEKEQEREIRGRRCSVPSGCWLAVLWLSAIAPHLFTGSVPLTLQRYPCLQIPSTCWVLPQMVVTGILILSAVRRGYLMAVPLPVFSFTRGLGIVVTHVLSYIRSMAYSVQVVVMVGLVMVMNAGMVWVCREV